MRIAFYLSAKIVCDPKVHSKQTQWWPFALIYLSFVVEPAAGAAAILTSIDLRWKQPQ